MDLANAIAPNCEKTIFGIRPGEKIHEEMITTSDGASTIDIGKYYAILPSDGTLLRKYNSKKIKYSLVKEGFNYSSGENKDFLSIEKIRDLIKNNIDKNFKPF